MARERFFLFSLNGGMVSPLALARTDLQRMRLTAETFVNCFPRTIGPMSLRGGLEYLGSTKSDGVVFQIPFIFAVDDTAKIELSNAALRVLVDNAEITRASVSTTITNGDFSSGTGWTLTVTGGGVANINSTVSGALVLQTPVRGGTAKCERSAAVAGGDQAVEHAIRLVVSAGTVRFRLGSTSGGQEILAEAEYAEGTHSLVFTPGVATIYVQLSAKSETYVTVDSIQIEGSGVFELATQWTTADLPSVRYDQSGDVLFIADGTHSPMRIERRGNPRSWSIVKYKFVNGPWKGKTANVTITPSERLGNITLTSSAAFFDSSHVGALMELTHTQTVANVSLAGQDVYSDHVRVAGLNEGTNRNVNYGITGTWNGTISLQISYDEGETWQNRNVHTVNNPSITIVAGSDNTVVFVRLGFQAGDYTSGTAVISLSVAGGGGTGIARITGYTSSTVVTAEVLERLHYTGATENWREGKFSDYQIWPSSVVLFEGRLWWGSQDQVAGSFSDDFSNYDVEEEGDAAPIVRSIATGPVNKVQWMLGLARLIIGTSGAESVARSSSFDEPMTPTNFSIKDASTYGSADIQAVKVDRSGVFTQRSGNRAYGLSYSIDAQDYTSQELTRYNPTILAAGVVRMAVQRQPDTRIWFIMQDGTAAVLLQEPSEDVIAWSVFETDGDIEDIIVLPNVEADDVFMIVKRTINGSTKRYRERLAYDTEAQGGTANYMADSYKTFSAPGGTGTAVVSGLTHLEGKSVVVWWDEEPLLDANGDPVLFTVTSGQITMSVGGWSNLVVGLYYEGQWKSTKLAYASVDGTAMSKKKIILQVAPILYKTHSRAIKFGKSFTGDMDFVPDVRRGLAGGEELLETYDYDQFALPGTWDTDDRLCMTMRAPMPCTVLGVGMLMESP